MRLTLFIMYMALDNLEHRYVICFRHVSDSSSRIPRNLIKFGLSKLPARDIGIPSRVIASSLSFIELTEGPNNP